MVSCSKNFVNRDFGDCRLAIGVANNKTGIYLCNLIMYSFCQIRSKQKGQITRRRRYAFPTIFLALYVIFH